MLNLLQRMYYKSSKIREVIHIDVIVFIAYILHFVCSYVFIIINKLIKLLTLFLFTQVKNLRSQVSRLAIVSIGDMFTHLHRKMDAVSIG
jgi:hypothetical protein